MRIVDVRFIKERDQKKLQQQQETMEKLTYVLPQRIAEKFDHVLVKVRYSSSPGVEISGFKGDERAAFFEFLQEIWEDPFLLE